MFGGENKIPSRIHWWRMWKIRKVTKTIRPFRKNNLIELEINSIVTFSIHFNSKIK